MYLALDLVLNKQWAIKIIDKHSDNFIQGEDWRGEIDLLKRLDNANILRVVDTFEDEQYAYVIEDVIDGKPFDQVVAAHEGPFAESVVLIWAKQLANLFIYLHSLGIIYRDLKPQNIILSARGNLTLIDFGAARTYKAGKTHDTVNLGTQGYAAPEQYRKDCQTDNRTDIYNLGAIMFQLLTGENPANPEVQFRNIRKINRKISQNVCDIVQKCLEFDPKNRYQYTVDLLYDLEHADVDKIREVKRAKLTVALTVSLLIFSIISLGIGIGSSILGNKEKHEIFWSDINQDQRKDYQTLYNHYWDAYYDYDNNDILPLYMLLRLLSDKGAYSPEVVNDVLHEYNSVPESVKNDNPLYTARINYAFAYFYTSRINEIAFKSYSKAPKNYDYAFQYYSFAVDAYNKAGFDTRQASECVGKEFSSDIVYPISEEQDFGYYCIALASRLLEDYRHIVIGYDDDDDNNEESELLKQAKKDIRPQDDKSLRREVIKAAYIFIDSETSRVETGDELFDILMAHWDTFEIIETMPQDDEEVTKIKCHLKDLYEKYTAMIKSEANLDGIEIDSKFQDMKIAQYGQELDRVDHITTYTHDMRSQ